MFIFIFLLVALFERQDTAHLTIATSTSAAVVAPGNGVSLWLDVVPKPKMHVYAPGQPGYIAIALRLEANPAYKAAKPLYPPAETMYMKVLNERQFVYTKPFRIIDNVTLAATPAMRRHVTEGTPLTIKGSVRYQACDDKICYLPTTVPVRWTINLTSRGQLRMPNALSHKP